MFIFACRIQFATVNSFSINVEDCDQPFLLDRRLHHLIYGNKNRNCLSLVDYSTIRRLQWQKSNTVFFILDEAHHVCQTLNVKAGKEALTLAAAHGQSLGW